MVGAAVEWLKSVEVMVASVRFSLLLLLAFVLVAGCNKPENRDVQEFEIHLGWNNDGKSQYFVPNEIRVSQFDRVRFVVYNDDDPDRDYNGDRPGKDNFHDVALLNYDGNGDDIEEDIEHEAAAGRPPARTQLYDNDYFTAWTKGTFDIICEVRQVNAPTHAELGMSGKFIVE
jgi:hypothetical protein